MLIGDFEPFLEGIDHLKSNNPNRLVLTIEGYIAILTVDYLGMVAVNVEDHRTPVLIDPQHPALEDIIPRVHCFLTKDGEGTIISHGLACVPT